MERQLIVHENEKVPESDLRQASWKEMQPLEVLASYTRPERSVQAVFRPGCWDLATMRRNAELLDQKDIQTTEHFKVLIVSRH